MPNVEAPLDPDRTFRNRRANTSRPLSKHVDEFSTNKLQSNNHSGADNRSNTNLRPGNANHHGNNNNNNKSKRPRVAPMSHTMASELRAAASKPSGTNLVDSWTNPRYSASREYRSPPRAIASLSNGGRGSYSMGAAADRNDQYRSSYSIPGSSSSSSSSSSSWTSSASWDAQPTYRRRASYDLPPPPYRD